MRKKLRLVMFEECNRRCDGCCNNDWDLKSLPVASNYQGYDIIMLTGGEPMLKPEAVIDITNKIRKETDAPIYLYTAEAKRALNLIAILHCVDGVTLTLHELSDIKPFEKLNDLLMKLCINKSFRLNVFKGLDISQIDTRLWKIKNEIEWIKDSPLPKNEVMKRLWT